MPGILVAPSLSSFAVGLGVPNPTSASWSMARESKGSFTNERSPLSRKRRYWRPKDSGLPYGSLAPSARSNEVGRSPTLEKPRSRVEMAPLMSGTCSNGRNATPACTAPSLKVSVPAWQKAQPAPRTPSAGGAPKGARKKILQPRASSGSTPALVVQLGKLMSPDSISASNSLESEIRVASYSRIDRPQNSDQLLSIWV